METFYLLCNQDKGLLFEEVEGLIEELARYANQKSQHPLGDYIEVDKLVYDRYEVEYDLYDLGCEVSLTRDEQGRIVSLRSENEDELEAVLGDECRISTIWG